MKGNEISSVQRLCHLLYLSRSRRRRGIDPSTEKSLIQFFIPDRAPRLHHISKYSFCKFSKDAFSKGTRDWGVLPHSPSERFSGHLIETYWAVSPFTFTQSFSSNSPCALSRHRSEVFSSSVPVPIRPFCVNSRPRHVLNSLQMSSSTCGDRVKQENKEDESRAQEHEGLEKSWKQEEESHSTTEELFSKTNGPGCEFVGISGDHKKELDRQALESSGNLGWSEAGWTKEEVFNWPNAISIGRLVSGPVLAWMILQDLWGPALVGLIISGVSDWLDGYVARKMKISSVVGSYLDPVADKVLVGSVGLSMAHAGLLHPALIGLIVARDGVLMGGAFFYRADSLHWQWKNWHEFFRISVGGAGKVKPLFISKVNTVLQVALIGVALLQPALSMDDNYSLVPVLSWSVAASTSISWASYVYMYLKHPDALAVLCHAPTTPSSKASSTGNSPSQKNE